MGMLFLFQSLFGYVQSAIGQSLEIANQIQDLQTDFERFEDIINNRKGQVQPTNNLKVKTLKDLNSPTSSPVLELNKVSYKYRPDDDYAITDISFSIKQGEIVALVGPSGCGKSSLMKCIAGILLPEEGEIKYFGYHYNEIDTNIFSNIMGFVDQNTIMFEDSIKNNLTMWKDNIKKSELDRATDFAEIKGRIYRIKNNYEAEINTNGRNFSSGELQRMEFARALIQQPQILLLDEFTSALDSLTEKKLFENIKKHKKTCLIAAHRLSTISACDKIIIIQHGQIEEIGSHDELIKHKGIYLNLIEND